jgi:hypothetical protein
MSLQVVQPEAVSLGHHISPTDKYRGAVVEVNFSLLLHLCPISIRTLLDRIAQQYTLEGSPITACFLTTPR